MFSQYYKRHDPQTAEEQEMMENLFDVLCSSLMATVNREKFLKGEGLQLMNLMLREKKLSRNGSLKVLGIISFTTFVGKKKMLFSILNRCWTTR